MGKRVTYQIFNRTITLTCKGCSASFEYIRSKGKHPEYCSKSCKQKSYRRRLDDKIYNALGERWRVK